MGVLKSGHPHQAYIPVGETDKWIRQSSRKRYKGNKAKERHRFLVLTKRSGRDFLKRWPRINRDLRVKKESTCGFLGGSGSPDRGGSECWGKHPRNG